MSRISAKLDRSRIGSAFEDYYRNASQRLERAALIAVDRAGREALTTCALTWLARACGGWGKRLASDPGTFQSLSAVVANDSFSGQSCQWAETDSLTTKRVLPVKGWQSRTGIAAVPHKSP